MKRRGYWGITLVLTSYHTLTIAFCHSGISPHQVPHYITELVKQKKCFIIYPNRVKKVAKMYVEMYVKITPTPVKKILHTFSYITPVNIL